VQLFTRVHFWSRDKDGGHTISAIPENPMLQANLMALFYRTWVMVDRRLRYGNRDFRPLCSCDLDLSPITFIYELDPYFLEIYQMCKYELPRSRLSNIIVGQTDRQTNIWQPRPKLYTMPLRGWSITLYLHTK